MAVVGLDIGSKTIKVAEVRRGGQGVEVVALGQAPTPPEAYENSMVIDPQLLGKAIKDLLKSAGISSKQVVSSVSGQSAVVVRVIEVPQMKPAELAETMKWEMERHVPFAASEVIMDYQPLERPEGYAEGQNMDVCLAVAQQDVVDRHIAALQAAGLKPLAVDVETLAASRALLELDNTPHEFGHTVCLVNIGASNTDVGIYRDKLLVFPRAVPMAGDQLTGSIAGALGVDMATAENYKLEYGEVLLAPPSDPAYGGGGFGGDAFGGGGFMDFGSAPNPFGDAPPNPFGAPPAPDTAPGGTGATPFDFSTPPALGQPAPAPAAPFDFSTPPAPQSSPFDFTSTQPEPGGEMPAQPASPFQPVGMDNAAAPADPTLGGTTGGFEMPAPVNNLPVPVAADPAREAMKVQVFNAMAPVLAELVQELRRSLDYYRGRGADAVIHEIVLLGGTAKLPGLADFLTTELGVPTRVADLRQNVGVTSKNYSPEYLNDILPLFPLCVGLGAYSLTAAPAGKGKGGKKK